MKKLLGLGVVASVIAPIATVVACGDENKEEHKEKAIVPTITTATMKLKAEQTIHLLKTAVLTFNIKKTKENFDAVLALLIMGSQTITFDSSKEMSLQTNKRELTIKTTTTVNKKVSIAKLVITIQDADVLSSSIVDSTAKEGTQTISVSIAGANLANGGHAAMTKATAKIFAYLNNGKKLTSLVVELTGTGDSATKTKHKLDLKKAASELKDADGTTTLTDLYFTNKKLKISTEGLERKDADVNLKVRELNYIIRMLISNAIPGFKYYALIGTEIGPTKKIKHAKLVSQADMDKMVLKHGAGWNYLIESK